MDFVVNFMEKNNSERILKIGQHFSQLWTNVYSGTVVIETRCIWTFYVSSFC